MKLLDNEISEYLKKEVWRDTDKIISSSEWNECMIQINEEVADIVTICVADPLWKQVKIDNS